MPPPVQLIFTDNPGSLPATYTLPPGLDLDLGTIRAKIDGAGASGDFLVCLSILSSDNKLMARVPLDATYATGDTVEGTWAPFLRTAGSAATGSTLSAAWLTATETNIGGLRSVAWTDFSTNDLTVFGTAATAGGAVTNTSGDEYLRGLLAGYYIVSLSVNWNSDQDNQGSGVTYLAATVLDAHGSTGINVINSTFFGYGLDYDLVAVASGATPGRWFVELSNGGNQDADVSLGMFYFPGDDLAAVF